MKHFLLFFLCFLFLPGALLSQTLAEALGYNKNDRVLIINADDYGMCHAENIGTEKVLEYAVVTSATMMMPCPWSGHAISYIQKHKMSNIGIHVALTSEWKHYRWRPMSYYGGKKNTLTDASGFMWRESHKVELHASLEDIQKEVHTQLKTALDKGVNLSHFDSHMGSLYGMYTNRIELLALAFSYSYEFGLPFRMPYIPNMLSSFRKEGFAILDSLIRSHGQPKEFNKRKEYFLKLFKKLPPGVTEIYIHPAISNAELKNITNSHKLRQADVDVFINPEIKMAIKQNNIKLISYEPLKKWQRKQMKWKPGLKAKDVFMKYRKILETEAKISPHWKKIVGDKKVWRK